MDPIFGKTANPPTIIQNINVGAGLVGSGVTAMEFPSLPTHSLQNTLYKQGIYPSLINKATLGKQHKNSDGSPKAMDKTYVNLINPNVKHIPAVNTDANFGLAQQHIDVLNPFKIHNGDARLTPQGEYSGNSYFTQDFSGIYGTGDALKGRNSNIYKHDSVNGKPLLQHNQLSSKLNPVGNEGVPILIQKNEKHLRPQVKYGQHDIPVFAIGADFTDIDESVARIAQENWTVNKHVPDISQTTDFIRQVGRFIPDEPNTVDYVVKKSQSTRPGLSINPENPSGLTVVKESFGTKRIHKETFSESHPVKSTIDAGVMNLIGGIQKMKTQRKREFFTPSMNKTLEETFTEAFHEKSLNDSDELYQELLRSYSVALCHYLNNSKKYSKWAYNWKILDENLKKTNLSVKRLDSSDKDVAYTQNKGDIIKFRWRDTESYIPRSVFAYVLMHELTHQVFPMSFQGHGDPFPDMLSIICVAGYELRIFDLKNIPKSTVYSNGQEITSRGSLTRELLQGIKLLREANPKSSDYYDQLEEVIKIDERA